MIKLLDSTAARFPNAPFLVDGTHEWTFAQVLKAVLQGAAYLRELGVEPGDRVLIAISNRPLFVLCWLAAIARGAIAVPISHESLGDALRYIALQSDSRMVLAEARERPRLEIELGDTGPAVHDFQDEDDFLRRIAPLRPEPIREVPDDEVVSILYTSGTTGQPKGVMIPYRSYAAIGEKISAGIGMGPADRIMTFLPLHHANPQMYALMSALTVGCAVVILPRFSASTFCAQVERFRPTGFTYVGTVLGILDKTIETAFASTLRWCVGGGAPKAVWQRLAPRLNVQIHELYGMTETGGMVTLNDQTHARFGSVGAVRDDFDVRVVDEQDGELAAGQVGEIVVRPRQPFVMTSGYFRKPSETLESMRNLWFHTGDLGRFDEAGFLFFEGRKKELIRRAGEMISPVEIELCALKHPQILDCAAVGVPDSIVDEEIKLAVVMREAITAHEIHTFLASRLERHKVPRYYEFIAEIPKTPTQKIQRFKLSPNGPTLVDLKAHLAARGGLA